MHVPHKKDKLKKKLLKTDPGIKALLKKDPTEMDNFIDTEIVSLDDARDLLKVLGKIVIILGNEQVMSNK